MKTTTLLVCLAATAFAPALRADPETDRRIENAASGSFNYRTVLQGHVKVGAKDGVVTLTGTVPEDQQKALAADTAAALPGVMRVDNQIKVEPPPPEHSDDSIAFKVRTLLLVKANVSVSNTKVEVQDGVVTLTGTADNLAQKELTEAYVREVDGVKQVNNRLLVAKPVEPERTMGDVLDDASITAQVKYALLTHRSTSALNTKVATKDGAVVIGGEAGNGAERDLVTKLAQAVRGVKSVQNDMTLKRSE